MVRAKGLHPSNVDATVVTERPRIAPHRAAMRERLAGLMGLPLDRVSVKASTNNGLGSIGRAEGVAVLAVVMLADAPPASAPAAPAFAPREDAP